MPQALMLRVQVLVLAAFCAVICGVRASDSPTVAEADRLFQAGEFAEAEEAYTAVQKAHPNDFQAAVRLGEIALLGSRLEEGGWLLDQAEAFKPGEERVTRLRALAAYRADDYAGAAELYKKLGRDGLAKKLGSFGKESPYRIVKGPDPTTIKFIHTDPLPLLAISVNGSDPINVILDTGGAELILDPAFAAKVAATRFGKDTGTFAGDKKADVEHARVDSVVLGELEIRDVPVQLLGTKAYSAAAMGKPVDGVLGLLLLSRFLFTIDYPGGQLILHRKTLANAQALERDQAGRSSVVVPVWLAGDHFLLAKGSVNGRATGLLFIDTGLAGGGFTCPESMIRDAGIELAEQATSGVGGGGIVKVTPFIVKELALGEATRHGLMGFFGPFPASLEHSHGFRIAGLVSHAFFRSYAVTVDLLNMRMRLQSP